MTHRELYNAGCGVIPCRANKKPALTTWKEFETRRPTDAQLGRWEQLNRPVWAVICGTVSGVVVLDFDGESGAETMINLGLKPHVRTPSGGFHVYFTHPGERVATLTGKGKEELGRRFPGMDVRGDGGYACCEGRTADGEYTWLRPFELDPWESLRKDAQDCLLGRKTPWTPPQKPTEGNRRSSDELLRLALAKVPTEGRNNRLSFLFQQLRDEQYTQQEAWPIGLEFRRYAGDVDTHGKHDPMTDAEISATLRSAYSQPARDPSPRRAGPITVGRNRHNPRKIEEASPGSPAKPRVYSDYSNAIAFHEKHGQSVRFNVNDLLWRCWNGEVWQPDLLGRVKRMGMEVVQSLYADLSGLDSKEAERLLRHIKASESDNRVCGLLELVKAMDGVSVTADVFDPDPWLVTVQNGAVDLKTGELKSFSRADYSTVQLPVRYDRYATCPRWKRYLEQVFPGDPDTQTYVQRMCGYLLTGDVSRQELYVLYGKPSCGKSVFAETITGILGEHAAALLKSQLLLDPRGGTNDRQGVAAVWNKRLATCSEFEEGDKLDEGLVKSLTGGDAVSVRHLYGRPFTVRPKFRVLLYTNHVPRFHSVGLDMKRRLRMIPFEQCFYAAEEQKAPVRDDNLKDKLRAELDGIFMWMLDGSLDYQRNGIPMSYEVRECTGGVFADMDVIGEWLGAHCSIHVGESALLKDLWRDLEQWCSDRKAKNPFTDSRGLRANLQNRDGILTRKTMYGVLIEGLKLGATRQNDAYDDKDAFTLNSPMREIS